MHPTNVLGISKNKFTLAICRKRKLFTNKELLNNENDRLEKNKVAEGSQNFMDKKKKNNLRVSRRGEPSLAQEKGLIMINIFHSSHLPSYRDAFRFLGY